MSGDDVDYAVPAAVGSARRRAPRGEAAPGALWGGRARSRLLAGCWAGAALLLLPLLVPLVLDDETGADTPEEAVTRLLQGIVDVDPVAIVAAVDPDETADPDRTGSTYDVLSRRLRRQGEEVPPDVTAVITAAESQVGVSVDLTAIATVAALDLELEGLELRSEPDPRSRSRVLVHIEGGDIDVTLDPGRLPDSVEGLSRATYAMPLTEGWRRDGSTIIRPLLAAVERDGRWYVSLEGTVEALVPGGLSDD